MLQCPFCNRDFRRSEHLDRHLLRHIGARPFSCSDCGTDFARRDTLLRHTRSHARADPALTDRRGRSRRDCVARACRACAESKQKCDGKDPCKRCERKKRRCVYVADQRRSANRLDGPSLLPSPPSASSHQEPAPAIADQASEMAEVLPPLPRLSLPSDLAMLNKGAQVIGGSCDAASAHLSSAEHQFSLVWPLTLPNEGFLEAPDPSQCPLTNWPLYSTDWSHVLSGAAGFVGDGNNSVPSSNGTGTEEMQDGYLDRTASSSSPSSSELAYKPSARAPNPLFTTKQALDTVAADPPRSVEPWPFRRATAHQAQRQQLTTGRGPAEACDTLGRVAGDSLTWKVEDYQHVPPLGQETYNVMCAHFATLNADNGFHKAFTDELFPSYEVAAAFIQAYFEHFQPIFPLIHQPTFDPRKAPWVLTLAVAVIGSRYSVLVTESAVLYLNEFLRRAISFWSGHIRLAKHKLTEGAPFSEPQKNERACASDPSSQLCLDQATVLNQIGMMFSGDMAMCEHAQMNMSSVALISKKAGRHSKHQPSGAQAAYPPDASRAWESWVRAESTRRLAYFSWPAPGTLPRRNPFAYTGNACKAPGLPDGIAFRPAADSFHRPPADPDAVRRAALGGGLGRIVDVGIRNGFYHCDELTRLLLTVAVYFDKPQGPDTRDCLDMLRRDEGQMAAAETLGWMALEYNHILSLLLHLPLRELMAFSGWHVSEAEYCEANLRMALWVRNEAAEARLVTYHAAKLYSCIREHPLGAYSETMSFLTATLAIWAVTVPLGLRERRRAPLSRRGGRAAGLDDRAPADQGEPEGAEGDAELRLQRRREQGPAVPVRVQEPRRHAHVKTRYCLYYPPCELDKRWIPRTRSTGRVAAIDCIPKWNPSAVNCCRIQFTGL
ncbi:hypothetical protein CSUB01_11011 [Colletotrichum sublineola]|uniref:Uncharacterized protein n=1 Tax=Colletotrichum sublineola TaxID=1173701 RepID=A0A066XRN3_COLSU|nr:hypothetical protein CSUB01_11011 [Colletotrichum sublineola]